MVILRRSDLQKVNYVRLDNGVVISAFYWANPTRVLFSAAYKFRWTQKYVLGENIWGVGATGLEPNLLSNWSPLPKHASLNTFGRINTDRDRCVEIRLINLLKNDDENMLVSARKRNAEFTDILKMNVETGAHEKVNQAPIKNADILVDREGSLRFATASDVKNKSKTYYRGHDSAEWRLINDEAISGKALDPLRKLPRQCAIGDVGVYDLNLIYKLGDTQRTEDGKSILEEALGKRNLDSASPVKLGSQIKLPVLLLAGRKDDRAPIQHTIAMAQALRRLNKPVEVKKYADEEHGNFFLENQIDHANRVLEFLDEHIGEGSQKAKTN